MTGTLFQKGKARLSVIMLAALMIFSTNQTALAADPTENTEMVSDSEAIAENTATFTVTIPKTVTLNGVRGESNEADYGITVHAENIPEGWELTVEPTKEFTMSSLGKADIQAVVEQDETQWNLEDGAETLSAGLTKTGKVSVSNLSSGEWKGEFTFNISVTQPETEVMAMAFSLASPSNAMYSYESLFEQVTETRYTNIELYEELAYLLEETESVNMELADYEEENVYEYATPSNAEPYTEDIELLEYETVFDYEGYTYDELLEELECLEAENTDLEKRIRTAERKLEKLQEKLDWLEQDADTEGANVTVDSDKADSGISDESEVSGTDKVFSDDETLTDKTEPDDSEQVIPDISEPEQAVPDEERTESQEQETEKQEPEAQEQEDTQESIPVEEPDEPSPEQSDETLLNESTDSGLVDESSTDLSDCEPTDKEGADTTTDATEVEEPVRVATSSNAEAGDTEV